MPNEKTPMEQLISDLRQLPEPDNRFTRKIIEAIILKAESYLPSERKMVEDAVDAVELVSRRYYKDGTHGDDPMGKEISDTGRHNDGRDYFGLSLTGSQYFDNRFGK